MRQAEPVIVGLEDGPFDMAYHEDEDRLKSYYESRLRLSGLGHALLAGGADFAKRGRISRWWGGTHLTNENCWRWDAGAQRLIPPA